MQGDLFVFRMIAPQCRLMCVDTVFEAIFNCDAMQVICVLNERIFDGADMCVDTACFWCNTQFRCHAR
eukprot:symbB.v1.2.026087.t1/scaffold2508.1/size77433/7